MNRDKYLSKSEILRYYKFNDAMFAELGPPDRTEPHPLKPWGPPMKLWLRTRVESVAAAHHPELNLRRQKSKERKARKTFREKEALQWAQSAEIRVRHEQAGDSAAFHFVPSCREHSNFADLEAEGERRWPGQWQIWRPALIHRFRHIVSTLKQRPGSPGPDSPTQGDRQS